MPTATRQTAAEAYAARRATIEAHLSTIDLGLEQHQKRQNGAPMNWGFAGDLVEVERLLAEAARILSAKPAFRS